MAELRLADGEEVVRQYSCTAVDNCAVFAGTVIPKSSRKKRESQGIITVTNRRVIYDMEASGRRQPSSIHQETSIDSISSVSSIMAKFGRDVRVPALMVIVGFILIFAPYVWAVETDALATDGDYETGYNVGVELGYYTEFMSALTEGRDVTIPSGYVPPTKDQFGSSEYQRGYLSGYIAGAAEAVSDIGQGDDFSVSSDLMIHNSMSTLILVSAAVGAVVFILGSVLYTISCRTKDWVHIRIGSGGSAGVFITSLSNGPDRVGIGPSVANTDYVQMIEEIGALITDSKRSLTKATSGGLR